ncbi:unnamed protein product [Timema podura]|uniref:Uncharacterized protein n=1 Tax=Timema podura TaxID=61482 RepID=A0ABN7NHS8_TIMPD|nr:unnamed protein product [Timema podura]
MQDGFSARFDSYGKFTLDLWTAKSQPAAVKCLCVLMEFVLARDLCVMATRIARMEKMKVKKNVALILVKPSYAVVMADVYQKIGVVNNTMVISKIPTAQLL